MVEGGGRYRDGYGDAAVSDVVQCLLRARLEADSETCVDEALLSRPVATAPFPTAALSAPAVRHRCVMSDSPMALIELNVWSRDHGLQNWVDESGRTYDSDASPAGALNEGQQNRTAS